MMGNGEILEGGQGGTDMAVINDIQLEQLHTLRLPVILTFTLMQKKLCDGGGVCENILLPEEHG